MLAGGVQACTWQADGYKLHVVQRESDHVMLELDFAKSPVHARGSARGGVVPAAGRVKQEEVGARGGWGPNRYPGHSKGVATAHQWCPQYNPKVSSLAPRSPQSHGQSVPPESPGRAHLAKCSPALCSLGAIAMWCATCLCICSGRCWEGTEPGRRCPVCHVLSLTTYRLNHHVGESGYERHALLDGLVACFVKSRVQLCIAPGLEATDPCSW